MTNIASALKAEIARVSRKEGRADTITLKKSSSTHRKEIAALKRRVLALEQLVRRLGQGKVVAEKPSDDETNGVTRFSAKGLAAHRRRLGLSAVELGVLLGASGQSVYNWEQGKARPRTSHMPAIAALRRLGKREAAAAVVARTGTTG
jgi:DNA-binding transcriptional regulator YiaG